MSDLTLELSNIAKNYNVGQENGVNVLRSVDLKIKAGEIVALVAPSGAGKSTLLHIAGLLDTPDTGQVKIAGQDVTGLSDRKRTAIRREDVGFVYQFHHLLPEFTALENVLMPLMIALKNKQQSIQIATELLASVGLSQRVTHRPSALSGGERQRVAIARALANNPACVLMDEPTGNLDRQASDSIERLMDDLAQQLNTAFVVVTHDQNVAARMDSIYRLEARRLERQA